MSDFKENHKPVKRNIDKSNYLEKKFANRMEAAQSDIDVSTTKEEVEEYTRVKNMFEKRLDKAKKGPTEKKYITKPKGQKPERTLDPRRTKYPQTAKQIAVVLMEKHIAYTKNSSHERTNFKSPSKMLQRENAERRVFLLSIALEKVFKMTKLDYMAHFFALLLKMKHDTMRNTLAMMKLHKIAKDVTFHNLQIAFVKIHQRDPQSLDLNFETTGIEVDQFEHFAHLTSNWHKGKVGTPVGKLNKDNLEKYLYNQAGFNKLREFVHKNTIKSKFDAFYTILYGLNSLTDDPNIGDSPPTAAFRTPERKPAIPNERDQNSDRNHSFKTSTRLNKSFELDGEYSDYNGPTRNKNRSLNSLEEDGNLLNPQQQQTANGKQVGPVVPKLRGLHIRRKTSDDLFSQLNSADMHMEGNSFTIEESGHKQLARGVDAPNPSFSLSTIHPSPRYKKSPIKDSLQKMFLSKRRDNFAKSSSPQKNRNPESEIYTERDRASEIKTRLNKISKLLLSPHSLTQRKIERYLRFEHSLFQVARICHGLQRRTIAHAFEQLQYHRFFLPDKHQQHLRGILQAANQRCKNNLLQSFYEWKKKCIVSNYALLSAKFINTFVRANYRDNLKYALWKIKENAMSKEDKQPFGELLPEKFRGAFGVYHALASMHQKNRKSSLQQFFIVFHNFNARMENAEDGAGLLTGIMLRSYLRDLRFKMKLGRAVKSFVSLIKRKEDYIAKDTWHQMWHHCLTQGSLSDRRQAVAREIYKVIIRKRDNHLFFAMMSIKEHVNKLILVEQMEFEALKEKKCIRLFQLLSSKRYWNLSSVFQRIKYYADHRQFIISNLYDTLKLIFLRKKVLIFTYIKTQTKMAAHYDYETDYFRHRLKNQKKAADELRNKGNLVAARNITNFMLQIQEKLKREAAKRIFGRLGLVKSIKVDEEENTYNIENGQRMYFTLEKIFSTVALRSKSATMNNLKKKSQEHSLSVVIANIYKITLLDKLLTKLIERKKFNYMHTAFQIIINIQHQEAFDAHKKLLKFGSVVNKCYMMKMQHGFATWKLDLEVCRAEWKIVKRMMSPQIYEDEESIREITDILNHKDATEEMAKLVINRRDAATPALVNRSETRFVKKKNTLGPSNLGFDATPIAKYQPTYDRFVEDSIYDDDFFKGNPVKTPSNRLSNLNFLDSGEPSSPELKHTFSARTNGSRGSNF